MPTIKKTPKLLSIGELAEAIGVRTDTIRAWERRYGAPRPVRLPSGHRRYTPEQLRWLRRVLEAVAAGHRPGAVMRRDEAYLDELLLAPLPAVPLDLEVWLGWVRRFDADALAAALRSEYRRLGATAFTEDVALPLLRAASATSSAGRLEVRHEHFLGELLHDQVRGARSAVGTPPNGPRLMLCDLGLASEELALQMAALIAAEKGFRVRLLGPDTPFEEVLQAASEMDVDGLFAPVPIVLTSAEQQARLQRLRQVLRVGAELCVGWPGARFARRIPRGVTVVREVSGFETWLRRLLQPNVRAAIA